MNLDAAVDIYVSHRRAMGQKCEGPAVALRAFCRRYGNKSLRGITPLDVKQFLDVPQTGPAAWRRKYGVLRDFFAYWRCRGKHRRALHPSEQQVRRQRPRVAVRLGKACEGMKLIALTPQVEAHGTPKCQILLDLLCYCGPSHAAPPGQGCAIAASRGTSTLA